MPPLLILVTGDPPPAVRAAHGGYDDMIRRTIGEAWEGGYAVADARAPLAPPGGHAGVVVTGSSASVHHREPWMLAAEAWLRNEVGRGTPVLGICFGHQLLAQALGGEVTPNPRGQERGTVPIRATGADGLLPAGATFPGNAWHDDTVARLPPGAVSLAISDRDENQMLRFAPRCHGVQFHPEFDGAVLRSYVAARADELRADGHDVPALERTASDTAASAGLLSRFAALLRER